MVGKKACAKDGVGLDLRSLLSAATEILTRLVLPIPKEPLLDVVLVVRVRCGAGGVDTLRVQLASAQDKVHVALLLVLVEFVRDAGSGVVHRGDVVLLAVDIVSG